MVYTRWSDILKNRNTKNIIHVSQREGNTKDYYYAIFSTHKISP